MNLKTVLKEKDISEEFKNTPVEDFFKFHNLKKEFKTYDSAQLLIGVCMDNRINLRIPKNFAYIIRTGGANLRYNELQVSFALAMARIRHIILIGHNHCGMSGLYSKKDSFVNGLAELPNWEKQKAENHFMNYAPMFEIDDAKEFVVAEAERFMNKYEGVTVTPAFYTVEDDRIYLIEK